MTESPAFREVNDAIRRLANANSVTETWEFFCECTDVACHALVTLTLSEFDTYRAASPPLPIFAARHDGRARAVLLH